MAGCRAPQWRSCRTRTTKLVGIRLRLDKKEGEGDELGYLRYPAVVEVLDPAAEPKGGRRNGACGSAEDEKLGKGREIR